MQSADMAGVLALFESRGVTHIHHCAPLHYFPYIARANALLSKRSLLDAGFTQRHFRSTSSAADVARGFREYVHLTVYEDPPILRAKLSAGFPHFVVTIPVRALSGIDFDLCRFNIARARYFKGAKQSLQESEANGRYYDGLALPIARTAQEKIDLFRRNFGKTMIEVLVRGGIQLPVQTRFRFFSQEDVDVAQRVVRQMGAGRVFDIELDAEREYEARADYKQQVATFLKFSVADSSWKGNGLNFDRV